MEKCPQKQNFETLDLYAAALRDFLIDVGYTLTKDERQIIYNRKWRALNPVKLKESRIKSKNTQREIRNKVLGKTNKPNTSK